MLAGPLHSTWADDSVFFTGDGSAIATLQKAQRLAGLILSGCRRHGMQPNLKKGKSAIILALRGKHSRAVRKKYFQEVSDTLEISLGHGKFERIHLEVQYTHLGTVLHRDANMMPEARLRLGLAAAAYKKYGKILLNNADIDMHVRK